MTDSQSQKHSIVLKWLLVPAWSVLSVCVCVSERDCRVNLLLTGTVSRDWCVAMATGRDNDHRGSGGGGEGLCSEAAAVGGDVTLKL